jgi:hypothetical protein
MANSPDKPGSTGRSPQPQQSASYFPIELTELDLANVVGGVAPAVHARTDGGTIIPVHAEGTIMCCW